MDPETEAARRVGTTLCHKWTLERLIGQGGMAAVYVAVHKIGRREAIKLLRADVACDPELRARFEQEAHAVNRFKHPGAVEIRDIDVADDGTPFLVMELLSGETLADLVRRPGGVALPDLLRLVDELLDVLIAAHAQGIIHRDIKPDNLFVQRDGRLKVLDFGIARVRTGSPRKPRTRAGAALGTAPYMPPEQVRGLEIDARADLFAVGATMFRILAGRRVHEAEDDAELIAKMAREHAPPLASVAPDVPPDVCLVVDRALEFDRALRYPDAAAMQEDVRALRRGEVPPHAHARLLEGTPAPSAMRAPRMFAPDPRIGEEATLDVPAEAPPGGARASDTAPMEVPETVDATLPSKPPSTRAATPFEAPPVPQVFRPPGADRTLQSPGADAPPPSVRRVSVAPPEAPRSPLPPGASVPVVSPARRSGPSGDEPNVGLLILVGVVFAAIGVGLTLLFMQGSEEPPVTAASAAVTVEEVPEPPGPWPRGFRPPPRVANPPPQPTGTAKGHPKPKR